MWSIFPRHHGDTIKYIFFSTLVSFRKWTHTPAHKTQLKRIHKMKINSCRKWQAENVGTPKICCISHDTWHCCILRADALQLKKLQWKSASVEREMWKYIFLWEKLIFQCDEKEIQWNYSEYVWKGEKWATFEKYSKRTEDWFSSTKWEKLAHATTRQSCLIYNPSSQAIQNCAHSRVKSHSLTCETKQYDTRNVFFCYHLHAVHVILIIMNFIGAFCNSPDGF